MGAGCVSWLNLLKVHNVTGIVHVQSTCECRDEEQSEPFSIVEAIRLPSTERIGLQIELMLSNNLLVFKVPTFRTSLLDNLRANRYRTWFSLRALVASKFNSARGWLAAP